MVNQRQHRTELERIMKDRGFTQESLADAVGAKQPQIQRFVAGERTVTGRWAKRMAVPLECNWLDLVDPQWFDDNQNLTRDETALVELYRGLSEDDRAAIYRVADAMAERAPAKVTKR